MNASVRVTTRTDNVAGVKLPVFVQVGYVCGISFIFHLIKLISSGLLMQYDTGAVNNENLGLVGGGRKILTSKDKWGDYLKALIKVGSLYNVLSLLGVMHFFALVGEFANFVSGHG
jgi:hypothetical protein